MPVYKYKGVDAHSKPVSGTIDADSERGARAKLRKMRVYPEKVIEEGQGSSMALKGKVQVGQVAAMSRQLSILLNARIPLIEALESAIDQVEHPLLKKALTDTKSKVKEGARIGDCLASYPDIFDGIYLNMVRAGEAGGSLDVVLTRLADYKEGQAELRASIRSAMNYPIIMIVIALLMLGYLFTSVVPKIAAVITKQKMALPFATEIVLDITYVVQNYWYLVLLGSAGVFVLFQAWKKSPSGRLRWDEWSLKVPVFGELNRRIAVARFARTLSTLLNSGVQLLPSLEIVKNVLDNRILAAVVEKVVVSVREGESLYEPLRRSGQFPSLFLQMIKVGEKTGQLEAMLERVADNYDKEVNQFVASMTSLITPVMLVFMGGAVAFIVMAVLMPILQMTEAQ